MCSDICIESYQDFGNSVSFLFNRKIKLKNLKPKKTSTTVSLVKVAAATTTESSFNFQSTSTPTKRFKRSSTKRVLIKLKKSIMTSTLITRKSDIADLSPIKSASNRLKKKRHIIMPLNSTKMSSVFKRSSCHKITNVDPVEFQRLNCPIRFYPNMRVKDINRLDDFENMATEYNNGSDCCVSSGTFSLSSIDYKMWII